MTAVLHDHPADRSWLDLTSSPALRLQPTTVPPGPGRSIRPTLRVLEGGRAPAPLARYRRRRLVAAAIALTVVVLAVLLTAGLVTGSASTSSPTSADATGAAGVAAPAVYVVRPGDTLWSIAARVAPDVDVRITVDRLVDANGPAPIKIGQELELPA
jgi:nucleoid-associated protein YgaU